jgi:hypothetical protein
LKGHFKRTRRLPGSGGFATDFAIVAPDCARVDVIEHFEGVELNSTWCLKRQSAGICR